MSKPVFGFRKFYNNSNWHTQLQRPVYVFEYRIWQVRVLNILSRQRQKELVQMQRLIFLSVKSMWHFSEKSKPRHIHVLRGHIISQIPALKSGYVPGIPGPNEAGHTNNWCIGLTISDLRSPVQSPNLRYTI